MNITYEKQRTPAWKPAVSAKVLSDGGDVLWKAAVVVPSFDDEVVAQAERVLRQWAESDLSEDAAA